MKSLSVRFYKRLILLILALMVLIPTILAFALGAQNSNLRRQLAESGKGSSEQNRLEGEHSSATLTGEPLEYQELYPELYSTAEISEQRVRASNVVYLTFDCMPGENTRQILDILDQYNIKATFFLMGTTDPEGQAVMREVANRGHSIGLSSYSGSYQQIYQSVESYLDDFNQIYSMVYDITGVRAEIFRFPAGSINSYNSGIYQELIAEMLRRKFIFFDWNVTGEDTEVNGLTSQEVADNLIGNMEGKDRGIVLLRDSAGKEMVTEALPDIITRLQEQGYSFQPLTAAVLPVIFSYNSAP